MKKNTIFSISKRRVMWGLLIFIPLITISCSTDNEDNPPSDNLGAYNTKTIQHEGVERTYHMYLPNNFDKSNPTPLVLALHGGGGTGANFEDVVSSGTLTKAAEARGIILVMPDGKDKRWNDGRPEIFGSDKMYDDIGFISSLIDTMVLNYGVDSNRVYATGISNGGFMSIRLGLELSEKIVAIAPVTAQITENQDGSIPSNPVSIMIVNGTDDPLVPYEGGCITVPGFQDCSRGTILSTVATIDNFRAFNVCPNPAKIDPLLDDVQDDTSIEVFRYDGCEEGTEVVLVKVNGGGHTWPGGAQYLPAGIVGPVSNEINASEMILDFFLRHSGN